MRSLRDTIDEKLKDFTWDNSEEPSKLILDTYAYAMLMEEVGHDPMEPFTRYRGLVIKVDADSEELCQVV